MRILLFALLIAGCNDNNTGSHPDLAVGGGGGICPGHPENCQGTCCGTKCVPTSIDINNCGACNAACTGGTVCMGGHCGCLPSGAPCAMTQTCCPMAGCADLMNDLRNCGQCGHSCGDGSTCENGVCKCGGTTCSGTQVCCSGGCAATCNISMPDMAMSSGMPACTCGNLMTWPNQSSGNAFTYCPVSNTCAANDCCAEDQLACAFGSCPAGTCEDTTPCEPADSTFN